LAYPATASRDYMGDMLHAWCMGSCSDSSPAPRRSWHVLSLRPCRPVAHVRDGLPHESSSLPFNVHHNLMTLSQPTGAAHRPILLWRFHYELGFAFCGGCPERYPRHH